MSDWGGINDEYEMTEWETQDEKWVQFGPHAHYLRLPIDNEKADRLMNERLWEHGGRRAIRGRTDRT